MGAQTTKTVIVTVLACAGVGLGIWQGREYFAERKPKDASEPQAPRASGSGKEGKTTTNADGSTFRSAGDTPEGFTPAAPAPEVPTQFVKVPSKPESVMLFEEMKPQVAQAIKAHAELGQSTGAAQNALVAAAVDALEKILGVNGTPVDVMGARPETPPGGAPETAVASSTVTNPPPNRGARLEGMESLLKDASIDASRATVEFYPDGAMGLPKRGKPQPGEQRQFQATMRMSSRMMSNEKIPTAEVRIPVKIKDSPSPGDDLDIGVMLERDESGEKWSPAGFNLHLKKPEIMKKLGGTMAAGGGGRRQQAPQTAPQAAPGGGK